MAFGFGFNKQKALAAAEKYVQQGKLSNAISEYEKVIKADPKDLTVTNTVGDLYSRLGDADKATQCFKTVGDAYASQGFTVKAIAMFKKISKLKPSLESVLKLAELYTQQGLFNDARSQYLQVADEFLKSGELENAVRIFQKILEMDPENSAMRIRLAEVYVRLNKKTEAWQIFSAAAETLRAKGSFSSADEVLQRMLALDPGNSYALLQHGHNLLQSGDAEGAIVSLKKVSDLDSSPEGLRDLFNAFLKTGRLSEAGTLAGKLLAVHNDSAAISSFADALMQAGQFENALQVYGQHAERMLAEDSEKVLKNLHTAIGHVRDNPASLEKLLDLFQKAGESTHLTEVIELLAHASVQSGDLPRARDLYQDLAGMEPGNPLHMNHYQQVAGQLSGSTEKSISAEEAAVIVDELEATSPSVHQRYSDAVALAVRAALTDAELFISYNMPGKALGPLTAALSQAPRDLRLNQRLAALHTRAARFTEAGACCRTIQEVYSEAGHPEEATRYGELAERYEMRGTPSVPTHEANGGGAEATAGDANTDELAAKTESAPWPAKPPHPVADFDSDVVADQDAGGGAGHSSKFDTSVSDRRANNPRAAEDIDLSSEWDDAGTIASDETPPINRESDLSAAITQTQAAVAADPWKSAETSREIRFYLEHGMPEQAAVAFEKLKTLTSDEATLSQLRAEIQTALQSGTEDADVSAVESISEFEETSADLEVQKSSPDPAAPMAARQPIVPGPPPEAAPGALQEFVSDLESSLDQGLVPAAVAQSLEPPAAPVPEVPRPPEEVTPEIEPAGPAKVAGFAQAQAAMMGELVADIEASLGDDFLKNAPVPEEQLPPALAAKPAGSDSPPTAKSEVLQAAAASAGAGSAGAHASSSSPTPVEVPRQSMAASVSATFAAIPAFSVAGKSAFGEEAGVDLAEMFGELKQDLEAGSAPDQEDPETHYNLGIAFREMGLLDEAIGELQKTCQAVDRGHPFPQVMQTYTWLAQCFVDKGIPEAAIRWYDKALHAPIDEDTRTALHYELGAAYETAGDQPSALRHFMEVYGRNIDYRDIAERVKALKS
jgi:tetratricopeptide (TPR) repeat protein